MTSQLPTYWQQACGHLAAQDPVMAKLIAAYPAVSLQSRGDVFHTLARAIVGQQISVKAADTVWARLTAALGDVSSAAVLRQDRDALRACGLSARKVEYLSDLAVHHQAGRLDPTVWLDWEDEAIIQALIAIRGIGRWSAEMFLLFYLLRPNVLPLADIGLIKAIALHYHAGERLPRAALIELAAAWQPWCSVATWYLWRSLDPVPVEY
ncbi:DNA-3-methyladenine glycosylase family protein [Deefgea salmonis]|uniref:DNA-3-methyladenine glycosylase II n=2 Tax=Deefgea TaxID=400947 RepID=A0ABS8BGZ6_9NEIS|nr:DNA-3-methyladenine glycosylase 2 family protein [Deefgea salmonis]MCB5194894.1 DNA-3-methyladenine glycosylase 2 family protein [Deefgea salmonis]